MSNETQKILRYQLVDQQKISSQDPAIMIELTDDDLEKVEGAWDGGHRHHRRHFRRHFRRHYRRHYRY